MLFLVRHAEPHASPQSPPAAWPLTAAGAAASARLRETLPPDALLVSSNEVKAWMTLGRMADVIRDDRFGEVRRRDDSWLVSREMVNRHGAADFWEELRFPDVLRVDLRTPSWDRPHVS